MSTLTNVVVFEGTSYIPDAKVFRATQLANPADELDRIKPSGDYSGRTDEIISSLISDYCNYVTAGTLSNGTAMGTITFSGDKTLRRILHQFAEIDGFTWYLKTQGQLFYDDGTNDTGVDITTDDVGNIRPSDVDAFYQNTGINAVIVRGAYVDGVRVESDEQTDEADILLNGKTRIIVTDGTINTIDLANSKALAILTREGSSPLTARFGWRNTTKGLLQKGQSITLKVDTTDVNITEQQFILDKIDYDGKTDQQAIECSTGLVFKIGDENERLPEENSQQIAQVAGTVNTINSDYLDSGNISNEAFDPDWDGVTDKAPSKNAVYDYTKASLNYNHYILLQDREIQNSGGGAATGGAWNNRVLNTEVIDTGNHCSLAANLFTLEAGTYRIKATAPAARVDSHQIRLYNNTDAAVQQDVNSHAMIGTSEYNGSAGWYAQSRSVLVGVFTITSSKAFYLQHYITTHISGFDEGFPTNATTEIFSIVELWKIG